MKKQSTQPHAMADSYIHSSYTASHIYILYWMNDNVAHSREEEDGARTGSALMNSLSHTTIAI